MYKREMKLYLKSFLIWFAILSSMFILIISIYPSLMTEVDVLQINQLLEIFPKEILKAFNMDISGINTAFGWIKTEGIIFILLVTASYSSILGSSIVLKEESEKTIEYLHSLPVTRSQIMLKKILCGLTYIALLILLVAGVNYAGLFLIKEDFEIKQFLLLLISPIFPAIVLFGLTLFISTFFQKTKQTFGVSLGLVFISYFLQVLSGIGEKFAFLKLYSVFSLADTRNIIENVNFDYRLALISISLLILFSILSLFRYNRKNLV